MFFFLNEERVWGRGNLTPQLAVFGLCLGDLAALTKRTVSQRASILGVLNTPQTPWENDTQLQLIALVVSNALYGAFCYYLDEFQMTFPPRPVGAHFPWWSSRGAAVRGTLKRQGDWCKHKSSSAHEVYSDALISFSAYAYWLLQTCSLSWLVHTPLCCCPGCCNIRLNKSLPLSGLFLPVLVSGKGRKLNVPLRGWRQTGNQRKKR